jgi:hypothetical protein
LSNDWGPHTFQLIISMLYEPEAWLGTIVIRSIVFWLLKR